MIQTIRFFYWWTRVIGNDVGKQKNLPITTSIFLFSRGYKNCIYNENKIIFDLEVGCCTWTFSYYLLWIYNISYTKVFVVIFRTIAFENEIAHKYFLPLSILHNLYCILFLISMIRFTLPFTNLIFDHYPTLLALNTMRFIILRLHKATMSYHC